MAHEIEMIDGQAQMAYAGETPWHGLGTKVSNDIGTEEMMKAAGLDWTVDKHPIYYSHGLAKLYPVDKKVALVRSNEGKVMDIVSDNWNPIQNFEAFEFFRDFVEKGQMTMDTAGSLKEGKMVWALAKVNDGFTIKTPQGEDTVKSYLLFSNPHEYGKSTNIRYVAERVVCNNTMSVALRENADHWLRLSHHRPFDAEEAKKLMGMADEKTDVYKEYAEFLASRPYTAEDVVLYFNRVFPSNSKKDKDARAVKEAQEVMHTQPGAELAEGTFWQLFNTVTFMTDHTMGRNKDTRLQSAWYGPNAGRKKKALEVALEMAR